MEPTQPKTRERRRCGHVDPHVLESAAWRWICSQCDGAEERNQMLADVTSYGNPADLGGLGVAGGVIAKGYG